MNFLTALAAFAVAIGILVVIHELGHYTVARWCGVRVLKFSIGFGHALFSWTSPKTGTEWTLSALPLGGFVKMLDERESEEPIAAALLPYAFNRQSVGKRMAIVAAGPVANFLLAIVLFAALAMAGEVEPIAQLGAPVAGSLAARAGFVGGELVTGFRRDDAAATIEPIRSWDDLRWVLAGAALERRAVILQARLARDTTAGLGAPIAHSADSRDYRVDFNQMPPGVESGTQGDLVDTLGFAPGGAQPLIAAVEPGSAAQRAGLLPNDRVLAVGGVPVMDVGTFVRLIQAHAAQPLAVQLERQGRALTLQVTPLAVVDPATGKTIGRIGAEMSAQLASVTVRYGPLRALKIGADKTWDISRSSLQIFGKMLVGRASLKNLSGPVTIADYAGRSARLGLSSFVSFLALVSISLGVLNLLPIPVLDGGHLLYYSAEAITGKAVSLRLQGILQRFGIVCILALSVVALFNDLTRLIHF
jgi:regulator of sigma E protease